jgi:hypothetical protein
MDKNVSLSGQAGSVFLQARLGQKQPLDTCGGAAAFGSPRANKKAREQTALQKLGKRA